MVVTIIIIDLSFATSQLEFLPTQLRKQRAAINANQKKIDTACNNVTIIQKMC